jgi:uncharacterized protein (DUF362 family)
MTTPNEARPYRVRAAHCDYRASDEEVYQALKRTVDPLERAWERLRKARTIGIKFNQDWNPSRLVMHEGHRQQLVSDVVARATLRLLRERTNAELFVVDVGVERVDEGKTRLDNTHVYKVMQEFDVPYVDGLEDKVTWVDVPGGGQMFDRYPIPQSCADADEMISVQKIKNHAFMGVTLTLKNLFGLVPLEPEGRPRGYYHHLVRMPYMLADLGRIFKPALNILDGLVCQAGQEWGQGQHPRICNTLMAGDHTVATDACAAALMGHDPQSDWLTPPFHRDRNALRVAAEGGFGTVNLDEIDFQSEVQAPIGEFFAMEYDSRQTVVSWRRTTAEQGLFYQENKSKLIRDYAGQYILLQMGEVKFADKEGHIRVSRRQLSGEHPDQAMWLKYVDPDEAEKEHFEVYAHTLDTMKAMGLA